MYCFSNKYNEGLCIPHDVVLPDYSDEDEMKTISKKQKIYIQC